MRYSANCTTAGMWWSMHHPASPLAASSMYSVSPTSSPETLISRWATPPSRLEWIVALTGALFPHTTVIEDFLSCMTTNSMGRCHHRMVCVIKSSMYQVINHAWDDASAMHDVMELDVKWKKGFASDSLVSLGAMYGMCTHGEVLR